MVIDLARAPRRKTPLARWSSAVPEFGRERLGYKEQNCMSKPKMVRVTKLSFSCFMLEQLRVIGLLDQNFGSLNGVMAGTVLDPKYKGNYPTVAARCVMRKLTGLSNWFRANDQVIDAECEKDFRAQFQPYYEKFCNLISPNSQEHIADECALGLANFISPLAEQGLEKLASALVL
jgi:hypothetical protein